MSIAINDILFTFSDELRQKHKKARYPNIFHTVSGKSFPTLLCSHYRVLLQVEDEKARDWYAKEAAKEAWSVRTLQRNTSSQYYYRLLKSQIKAPVENGGRAFQTFPLLLD